MLLILTGALPSRLQEASHCHCLPPAPADVASRRPLPPSLAAAAGRRNYAEFLSQYSPPLPGRFVDVDSGAQLGPCPDLAAVTHGQRPGIGGAPERVYAAGKDVVSGGGVG